MHSRNKIVVGLLTLALALSIVSAQAGVQPASASLSADTEAQAYGAGCGTRWGLTVGLALGAFSPCGIVCAVGAWYSIAFLADC